MTKESTESSTQTSPRESASPAAPGDLLRTFSDPSGSNSGHFGEAVIGVGGYVFAGASPLSGNDVVYMFDSKDGALIRTFSTPTPECSNGGFGRILADFQGNLLVGAWGQTSGVPGEVHLFRMIGTIPISPANVKAQRIESKKSKSLDTIGPCLG